MSNYFGRIVYTRCRTSRDLHGVPVSMPANGGEGVYTVSADVAACPAESRDDHFVESFLNPMRNQSCVPDALFDSYVYLAPPIGKRMLGRIHPRTAEECSAASAVRVDSRWPVIQEWLVGDFDDRCPAMMMGSPAFTAADQPIAAYYNPQQPPMAQPVDGQSVPDGPITREVLDAFVSEHGAMIVADAAMFLLRQAALPPQDRRTLLILDTEANARLWIAAITSRLPLPLARSISFTTSYQKQSMPLRYAWDTQTERCAPFRPVQPGDNAYLMTRCSYDIACVNPALDPDPAFTCPPPYAEFVVLDGGKNTLADEPLPRSHPFLLALAAGGTELERFYAYVAQMTACPLDVGLAQYYAPVMRLEEDDDWRFGELCESLAILGRCCGPDHPLLGFVMDGLCTRRLYMRFCQEDANGFPLLRRMLPHTDAGMKNAIVDMVCQQLRAVMREAGFAARVTAVLDALHQADPELDERVLKTLVCTHSLDPIDADRVRLLDAADALGILSLVSRLLRCGMFWDELAAAEPLGSILRAAFARLGTDQQSSQAVLDLLRCEPSALEAFADAVPTASMSDHRRQAWWEQLRAACLPLDAICRRIMVQDGEPEMDASRLLSQDIRQHGLLPAHRVLAKQYLDRCPRAAASYYQTVYDVHRDDPDVVREVLTGTNVPALHDLHLALLKDLDAHLPIYTKPSDRTSQQEHFARMAAQADLVHAFAQPDDRSYRFTSLWRYLYAFVSDSGTAAEIEQQINPDGTRFTASYSLWYAPIGRAYIARMARAVDSDPYCALLPLMTFDADRGEDGLIPQLADQLVSDAMDEGCNGLPALLDLRLRIAEDPTAPEAFGYDVTEACAQLDGLLAECERSLSEMFPRNTAELAVRAGNVYGPNVIHALQDLLERARARGKRGMLAHPFAYAARTVRALTRQLPKPRK